MPPSSPLPVLDRVAGQRLLINPSYLRDFRCIGPACEDDCCHGWDIPVDVQTYRRFQAEAAPELSDELRRNVIVEPPHAVTDERFARMRPRPGGQCSFLNAERLCSLQLARGADYLSDTCLVYPRVSFVIDDTVDRGLMLSCPEAARLALLDPAAMDPVESHEPDDARMNSIRVNLSRVDSNDPAQFSRLIRDRSIGLLRVQGVSLEARFLGLGMALRRLTDLPALDAGEVSQTFDLYQNSLTAVQQQLAELSPRHSIQIELVRELAAERLVRFGGLQRYLSCVDRMARGLQLAGNERAGAESIERYSAALASHFDPYVAARPWFFENMLVNHVYTSSFPFVVGRSMFEEFVLLVVLYALAKLHLVGVAAHEGRLDDGLAIEVVQSLHKAVSHDGKFLVRMLDLLRQNDVTGLAFMAILIVS